MTIEELCAIMPGAERERAAEFLPYLNAAMAEFDIDDNIERETMFLAQIAHESMSLRAVIEISSGQAYEHRSDLGNTKPGDGPRFKGRGLIQITGRENYRKCGEAFGVDLVAHPEFLEAPELACRSAAWYWFHHGLNELADAGDFKRITKRINGGMGGYPQRLACWDRARSVLA